MMRNILEWTSCDFSGQAVDLLDCLYREPYVFLLESSLEDSHRGRYSFIGVDPFKVFKSRKPDALAKLRREFLPYASRKKVDFSPLAVGGVMGYLSYDFGLPLEKIKRKNVVDIPLPDCLFGFYDCIMTIDHLAKKLYVSSTGLPEKNSLLRRKRAKSRLTAMTKKLSGLSGKSRPAQDPVRIKKTLKSNFTKKEYIQAVKKALDYIRQGDIYQVNLSQRFCLDAGSLMDNIPSCRIYKMLRELSPSCFGGYFDGGDFQIISSSPELFLRLRDGVVETRPMKGTRPRGGSARDDKRKREELLRSEKDRAELLMITDLERNDLGRVCDYNSIRVKEMRTLEEYKTVFQATSTVEGVLKEGKDAFDLVGACFPGGSITGCPKIRAMQIIEDLEPSPRSIYTGSMGYVSFSGDMDLNILIRTLLVHGKKVYFHVGGGIVADSTPEGEYRETLVKAKAMQECLRRMFY